MADLVRFVDSIVASPTVRLDLNGEATNGWYVRSFSAPAPRLRRSMSSNAMRDGISVGSSSYDARTLTIELECIKNDQDSAATELQKLARELDRESNFIMYQPDGASKPVFFKTFRSDLAQIDDVIAQTAMRRFTIELLAEPFAIGLRETLGPFTVSNDPAAATNGCHFDVSNVLGDVETPPILVNESGERRFGTIAVRRRGTPPAFVFQAESLPFGTDTSNPGGGPDAAMSGTDTNNFARTTFATNATMLVRLNLNSLVGSAYRGTYRAWVVARRSDATSVIRVGVASVEAQTTVPVPLKVELPLTTERILVDMGLVTVGGRSPDRLGGVNDKLTGAGSAVVVQAERASGAGSLDWDYVVLAPADDRSMAWDTGTASAADYAQILDATSESMYRALLPIANLFTIEKSLIGWDQLAWSGGLPLLSPNQINRLVLLVAELGTGGYLPTKTIADTWTVHYWPRYLYVRPAVS